MAGGEPLALRQVAFKIFRQARVALVSLAGMASKDTRRLPAAIRRAALETLSRDRLLEITDDFDLYVEDRRVIDHHINALVRSRSVDFASVLEMLSRDELKDICDELDIDSGGRERAPLIERIMSLAEDEPKTPAKEPAPEEPPAVKVVSSAGPSGKDARNVFIIHGRETTTLQELKRFLKSLGLHAWTFADESHEAPPNTHIAQIVSRGVSKTRAVIALFTPDELSSLHPSLRKVGDPERDDRRWQPRPNVLYEAGMAMSLNPEGTILVSVGHVELPSDLSGILSIRLSNETKRNLRKRLIQAGCAVNMENDEWTDASEGGDFSGSFPRKAPADPFASES